MDLPFLFARIKGEETLLFPLSLSTESSSAVAVVFCFLEDGGALIAIEVLVLVFDFGAAVSKGTRLIGKTEEVGEGAGVRTNVEEPFSKEPFALRPEVEEVDSNISGVFAEKRGKSLKGKAKRKLTSKWRDRRNTREEDGANLKRSNKRVRQDFAENADVGLKSCEKHRKDEEDTNI